MALSSSSGDLEVLHTGSLTSRDRAVPETNLVHGAPEREEEQDSGAVWSVGVLKPENREVRGHLGLEPDGEGGQMGSINPTTYCVASDSD